VDRDARAALSLIREAVKDCALLGWGPPLSDPRLADLRHKTQPSGVSEVSIIDALGRICRLQPSYTSTNTPEMQERGRLIRHTLPDEFNAMSTELKAAMGPMFGAEFAVAGLKQRFGESRLDLTAYGRTPWS
jgi:hypothetical protein